MLTVTDESLEKYEAGDALVWSEISWRTWVPPHSLEHTTLESTMENPQPGRYFITSPNIDFILTVHYDDNCIWI